MRRALLALSRRPRLGVALERMPLTRRFVRRFVAGTRPDEALTAMVDLKRRGLLSAVTYLGENVTNLAAAERATSVYLGLLDEIERRGLPAAPSVKLTHLGLDVSETACVANVRRLLERAAAAGTRVWIDMESSTYTARTLAIHAALARDFPNCACVVQAYLRRAAADVDALIERGAAVRLCKGAYREPRTIAFEKRSEVDTSYAALVDRLLAPGAMARGTYPAFATHDPALQRRVAERARAGRIGPERFEVQMLYGIRADLHATLRGAGVRLRVLVPFGEDWYGYFMRRLAERPANLLFFARHFYRR